MSITTPIIGVFLVVIGSIIIFKNKSLAEYTLKAQEQFALMIFGDLNFARKAYYLIVKIIGIWFIINGIINIYKK